VRNGLLNPLYLLSNLYPPLSVKKNRHLICFKQYHAASAVVNAVFEWFLCLGSAAAWPEKEFKSKYVTIPGTSSPKIDNNPRMNRMASDNPGSLSTNSFTISGWTNIFLSYCFYKSNLLTTSIYSFIFGEKSVFLVIAIKPACNMLKKHDIPSSAIMVKTINWLLNARKYNIVSSI